MPKYFTVKEQREAHRYMVKAFPGSPVHTQASYWSYSSGDTEHRLCIYVEELVRKEFRSFGEFVKWIEYWEVSHDHHN